jgi:intein/homing endonuclease
MLNLYNKAVIQDLTTMVLDPRFYQGIKAVKIQRQATPVQREFVKMLKQLSIQEGFKLIYEIDDIVFREDIPDYNRNKDAFVSDEIRNSILDIMRMCDEVTVTCDHMRDYFIEKTGNKNTTVIPNYLLKWWFDRYYNLGDLIKKYEKNKKKPVISIFASGTHTDTVNRVNQNDDFAAIVSAVMKTRKDFQWQFYGCFPLTLKPFVDSGEVIYKQWVQLPDFPAAMAESGSQLTFAALQNNNFNRSKCVTGDTIIQIKDEGFIKIKDFCESKYTTQKDVRVNNTFKKIDGIYISPEKEKIIKIVTNKGYELKGTETHRVKINNKWVEMKDIKVGDVVNIEKYDIQENLPYQELKMPFWQTQKISTDDFITIQDKNISPYIKVNEEFARLFGYILSDGHLSSGNYVSITCCKRDKEVIDDVTNLITQMGITPKIHKSSYDDSIECSIISCNSKTLRQMFEWMGFTTKSKSKDLSIPNFIWKSKRSVVANFIQGLFELDGTVSTEVSFCTKSEKFAKDIQIILLGFGIFTTHTREKSSYTKGREKVVTGEHSVIRLTRESCDIFQKEIGFVSNFKKDKLKNVCEKKHINEYNQTDEVVSVEYTENEIVYDISVPGLRSYCANGILSHNSNIKLIEAGSMGVPCICPDMCTYQDALLKYKTGDEFIDQIRYALKDQTRYADLCKKSRLHAEDYWLEDEKNLGKHYEAYFTPFDSSDRKWLLESNPV